MDVEEDCLLVEGGQGRGEPDMLTLLPLTPQLPGGSGRMIPWFGTIKGFATVPRERGAAGAPAGSRPPKAIMILTEGGQLVVHQLQEWRPTPITLPFQVGHHGMGRSRA